MFVIAGWIAVAAVAALLVTQYASWTSTREVVALQALTPYLVLPAFPVAALALVARRWSLAGASGAIAVVFVTLCWPLLFPKRQPAVSAGATPVRVFHGNLLYANPRPEDVPRALAALDADVFAFTEYTAEHASIVLASTLAHEYPYRIEYPKPGSGGSAIWSRYPLSEIDAPDLRVRSSAAVVDSPEQVTLFVVHLPSPMASLGEWRDELGRLALLVTAGAPAMVIGDFNASYWHPQFRDVLDAGWRDAHQMTGRGFSSSWPTDIAPMPPFVRIDHALVNDGLVVTNVDDIDVPGSDHRGLLVDVAVAVRLT